jgi:hypothetical protein
LTALSSLVLLVSAVQLASATSEEITQVGAVTPVDAQGSWATQDATPCASAPNSATRARLQAPGRDDETYFKNRQADR